MHAREAKSGRRLTIHRRMVVVIVGGFVLSAVGVLLVVDHYVKELALREAEDKSRILLDRNLATHAYFTEQLKPAVFGLIDGVASPAYFDPVWMSSTYAVRAIEERFRALAPRDYVYKEAAVDARTPANEADDVERAFIERLNADPGVTLESGVREIDGEPYFEVLRRGESMLHPCLRCHSEPERAPADLVARFGPVRSFHRSEGDVVSAISIRVPLAAAYAQASSLGWTLSLLFVGLLLVLLVVLYVMNRRLLLAPLEAIRRQAARIASDTDQVGEQIPERFGHDWDAIVGAFNDMSRNLRHAHDGLEARVQERTVELRATNAALAEEITERRRAETENERLIAELRQALLDVRTLSGIVPICAHCKKIRDDKGYWQQVEAFVSTHTDARFSHSLCPSCVHLYFDEEDLGPLDDDDEPVGA